MTILLWSRSSQALFNQGEHTPEDIQTRIQIGFLKDTEKEECLFLFKYSDTLLVTLSGGREESAPSQVLVRLAPRWEYNVA